ncbi:MAG: helix-turn-helix domain-containing protein [Candidatus Thermoplasmatota archaeon]|jgi:predicted DNA binding protein|nr:helix-turn-helix domain-containing protein [Candidatus Thermoplasmatota archaeon]
MADHTSREVVLKIERSDCSVANILSDSNIPFTVKGQNVGPQFTKHLVELDEYSDTAAWELRVKTNGTARAGKNLIYIDSPSCSACKVLADAQCIVLNVEESSSKWVRLRLLVPGSYGLKKLLNLFEERGVNATVIKDRDFEFEDLTDRQNEILTIAYNEGYFDLERKASLTEIAKRIGISTPTMEEIIRRAMKKLVERYIRE